MVWIVFVLFGAGIGLFARGAFGLGTLAWVAALAAGAVWRMMGQGNAAVAGGGNAVWHAPRAPGFIGRAGGWLKHQAHTNPMATAVVGAGAAVVVLPLMLLFAGEGFAALLAFTVTLHVAVVLTLAWTGKLDEAYEAAVEHLAIVWAYVSAWAIVLAAAYEHPEWHRLDWWESLTAWAGISFVLAVLAATGALSVMGKALGSAFAKAALGEYGAPAQIGLWSMLLFLGGFVVRMLVGGDVFDIELGSIVVDFTMITMALGVFGAFVLLPVAALKRYWR